MQLNVAFDEPLIPDGQPGPVDLAGLQGLTDVAVAAGGSAGPLEVGRATVVLAGDGAGPAAEAVAAAAQVPLLAEPSAAHAGAIPGYRLLLDEAGLGQAVQRVIVFGRPTLSRPVSRLLARDEVDVIVVSARPSWTDAARRASRVRPSLDPSDLLGPAPDPAWLARWQQAGQATAGAIGSVLDAEAAAGRLTGPLIAREARAVTGPQDALVSGSSNPIRDLDLAGGLAATDGRVLVNRGLAGIDGVISTACGVALTQTYRRTRALVGDLTFLHDAGALSRGTLERIPDLQIVVADDSGGGIFEVLEHGELAHRGPAERALFERFFATPQRADLAALCAGYGARHTLVNDLAGLRQVLAAPPGGLSVVQCPIGRTGQRALMGRIAAAVRDAL